MKRKGWHLVSGDQLTAEIDAAYARDPQGLCDTVTKALNDLLIMDPHMNGWRWAVDWHNLPGAISIAVTGTAIDNEAWDCPAFLAATSIATYEEVDAAAKRLQERIQKALNGWKRPD